MLFERPHPIDPAEVFEEHFSSHRYALKQADASRSQTLSGSRPLELLDQLAPIPAPRHHSGVLTFQKPIERRRLGKLSQLPVGICSVFIPCNNPSLAPAFSKRDPYSLTLSGESGGTRTPELVAGDDWDCCPWPASVRPSNLGKGPAANRQSCSPCMLSLSTHVVWQAPSLDFDLLGNDQSSEARR